MVGAGIAVIEVDDHRVLTANGAEGRQIMATGTCKLTGDTGPLVKAHILPAALTSPPSGNMPFAQAGRDTPPIKRWTSWYDANIVTRAGEDILAKYDTWAVDELRRHRLVWSGWGDGEVLDTPDYTAVPDMNGWGFRRVEGLDGRKLRLFFLSLLWRAAVSEMPEFVEISVRASGSRRLRRMLKEGDIAPLHFFPMSITQLSTRGDVHNLTPLAQNRPRDVLGRMKGAVPIFRFYLDGLIIHIHRESSASEVAQLGDMMVGAADTLTVGTVTFNESWQRMNMDELVREATERWPDRLSRIPGFR